MELENRNQGVTIRMSQRAPNTNFLTNVFSHILFPGKPSMLTLEENMEKQL